MDINLVHTRALSAAAAVWPLVGRRRELEYLGAVVARPQGPGLVLAGQAGVGKTRLVREAVALGQQRGIAAVWAAGTESGRSIPFGALAHLLPPELPGAVTRDDVVVAAGRALRQGGAGRPVVVGVDDAHLLDGHSAVLLHHLARQDQVVLVVSVRSGEAAPDAVTALWKDDYCHRLEVHDLVEDEVGELLEAVLGGKVEGATRHQLFQQTRGNPLYLRELLLAGLESETLVKTVGLWRLAGPLAPSMRLRELVASRLGRLGTGEWEALEVVAQSEPVEVGILADLLSAHVLATLERAGLLVEERDGRRPTVRLSHPLYAEVLRAGTPPVRLRSLAATLAAAIERTGARRRQDLLRLAVWQVEAGLAGDPEVLLAAAAAALRLCDFTLAERLARAAVKAGAGLPAPLVIAQALMGQGRFTDVEQLLARIDAHDADEAVHAQVVMLRAQNLTWNLNRARQALLLLEAAEQAVADPHVRDELAAARSYQLLAALGRAREAVATARPRLGRHLSDAAQVQLLGAVGQGLIYDRRPEEALEILDHWHDRMVAELQQTAFAPLGTTMYECGALFFAGRLKQAVAFAQQAYQDALELHAAWVWGVLAASTGVMARAQGRVRTALGWLREGVGPLLHDNHGLGQLSMFLAETAHAHALLGEHEPALAALDDAEATACTGMRFVHGFVAQARVWVTVAGGEISQAVALALDEAHKWGQAGCGSWQVMLLHDVARLGRPQLVAADLKRLVEDSDSALFHAFARHARALAAGDASSLAQLAQDFEAMGAYLLAAEAAAQATHAYREHGRNGTAHATSAHTRILADRCEGANTPALEGALAPLPLTRRQREVATLAARGLTNPEIAERLVVSPRTVGNHLQEIYSRLDVSGRYELAAILRTDQHAPTGT